MKKSLYILLFCVICLITVNPLYAEESVHHGGDAVFSFNEIGIFWAMLRGDSLESSEVYISIVQKDLDSCDYEKYSVIAANIFTGEEKVLVDFQEFDGEHSIIQKYSDFNKLSKRRILFFKKGDDKDHPSLEVYYAGMPDTTPVLMSEEQITMYFNHSKNMVWK